MYYMQMHYIFTPGQSRCLQNSLNGPKIFFCLNTQKKKQQKHAEPEQQPKHPAGLDVESFEVTNLLSPKTVPPRWA